MAPHPPGYFPPGYFPPGYFPPGTEIPTPESEPYVPPQRTIVVDSPWDGCGTARVRHWKKSKGANEPSRYRLDFTAEVARYWQQGLYATGTRLRVGGFDAYCAQGGFTGLKEPRWPQVPGTEVTDGSVIWEIHEPTADSLVPVDSITWVLPDGITITDQHNVIGTDTSAVPLGGEVGKSYTIVIEVRFTGGEGFDQPCVLHIDE